MLQDTSGAKEDTLRSLLLDTNCEDTLPLVARLFPGSSLVELANSNDAQELRASLIIHEAPGATKTEDDEMREKKSVAMATDKYVNDIVKELCMESLDNVGQEVEEESKGIKIQQSSKDEKVDIIEEEATVSPRSWAVLSYPSLSFDMDALKISSLSHNKQEKKFHSLVYYTKKSVELPW